MPTLIVLTRDPRPGRSKTRLIAALGPEGAALLQVRMTRAALDAARAFAARRGARVEVRFTDGRAETMAQRFGADLVYRDQGGGDLGARLERAVAAAFEHGGPVLAIGADCPDLDATTLERALDALAHAPLVLGPARDGGYVLIGLARPCPELFRDIPWSTADVLRATLDSARDLGLDVHLLPTLDDVDEPADLERAAGSLARLAARYPD